MATAQIERGKKFQKEISDLVESLTIELQDLGQLFGDTNQYKEFLNRVKSADFGLNLQTILGYGIHVVQNLYDATSENMRGYIKIGGRIKLTYKKLEKNQIEYTKWSNTKEELERKLNILQSKMDKSDSDEFKELVGQKAELNEKLEEAKVKEGAYFRLCERIKQNLSIQRPYLKAYTEMIESLLALRKGIEEVGEKIEKYSK